MERADIVVLVIDAVEGVTEQDAKIAGIAHERGKGIIVAVNKWDAVEKDNKTVNTVYSKGDGLRFPLCRMRRSFLFLRDDGPASAENCLRQLIWSLRTRACVSRQVYLTKS